MNTFFKPNYIYYFQQTISANFQKPKTKSKNQKLKPKTENKKQKSENQKPKSKI